MPTDQPKLPDPTQPPNRLREPIAALARHIPPSWQPVTAPFFASEAGRQLAAAIDRRVAEGAIVYPATPFKALELTPRDAVRVVILGQDPYHGPGQAQGLAFSVPPGVRPPPSLRNILAEVEADLGRPSICRDDLSPWARQGVLLLNATMTVEDGKPQSHAGWGWEVLSDALVRAVAEGPAPVVFMLWGTAAQRKSALVGPGRHAVLVANHPSPLSARRPPLPFLGCRPFSAANAFLERSGDRAIEW